MVLILTLNTCNDYPKQSSKYRSKDRTRKRHTDIDERQWTKDSTLFFYKNNFKGAMRFTGK